MRLIAISLTALLALSGCALLPEGTDDPKPDPEQTETEDFAAPDTIGDWTTQLAWAIEFDEEKGGDKAEKNEEPRRADREVDAQILSDNYGADAIVEAYQRDDMNQMMQLRMVATKADGYFLPAVTQDAEWLGLDIAPRELQTFGDVQCFVQHSSMDEETEDNTFTECTLRGESLTIWLGPTRMLPEDMADLTQEAWDEIGGGDTVGPYTASTTEIELPETLPGFVERASVQPAVVERSEVWHEQDLEALASTYGADAGAGNYASPDLVSGFQLYIVDAVVVAPYVQYLDAERIGLVAPTLQRVEIDGATCLVSNMSVPFGGDESKLKPKVQWCYLTEGGRTAFALNVGGDVSEDTGAIPAILSGLL